MVNLVISSAQLLPYKLRVSEGVSFAERTGRLLRLETANGKSGWGDVAPLPGFSRETAEHVDAAWGQYSKAILNESWPLADFSAPERWTARLRPFDIPSFRFGLEQAMAGLSAQVLGSRVVDILAPEWQHSVSVAGLITGSGETALKQASDLGALGYRTIKIKVGRRPFDRDVDTVLAIRALVGDDVELRLDANRSWTPDEAVDFIARVQPANPAFIEEPVSSPQDMYKIWHNTGASIALDETLLDVAAVDLNRFSFATHIVVKPTLLGGIAATENFIEAARRLGITPVVSAAYESGLGISVLACLAARWCPDGPAAGLDTYRRLESDVIPKGRLTGPTISPEDLRFEPEVEKETR